MYWEKQVFLKNVYKSMKNGLVTWVWIEKAVNGKGNTLCSGLTVISEKGQDDIGLGYESIHQYGLVSLFNGILTFVGYLMQKPFS